MIGDPIGGEVEENAGTPPPPLPMTYAPYAFLPPSGGNDIPALRTLIEDQGARAIWCGPYVYHWSEYLPSYPNLYWRGQGPATHWLKNFHGDLHRMGSGCHYERFTIWCNGDQWTGAGIATEEFTHFQIVEHLNIYQAHGRAFEVIDGSGNGLKSLECNMNSIADWAGRLPNLDTGGGGNRKIIGFDCGGLLGIDFGGSNNTVVERFNANGMTMNENCRSLSISKSRIGYQQLGELPFRGQLHKCESNRPAHPVVVEADCLYSYFQMGAPGQHNGVIRNDPLANGNVVLL